MVRSAQRTCVWNHVGRQVGHWRGSAVRSRSKSTSFWTRKYVASLECNYCTYHQHGKRFWLCDQKLTITPPGSLLRTSPLLPPPTDPPLPNYIRPSHQPQLHIPALLLDAFSRQHPAVS